MSNIVDYVEVVVEKILSPFKRLLQFQLQLHVDLMVNAVMLLRSSHWILREPLAKIHWKTNIGTVFTRRSLLLLIVLLLPGAS